MEAALSALSPAELCFHPGMQRWSILMALEHIVISEEGIADETLESLIAHLDNHVRQILRIQQACAPRG
jgi:hypothetical protein